MARTKIKKETYTTRTRDTKVSVIEKEYGVKLGVPSDMKLGVFFEKKGYKAFADMLD